MYGNWENGILSPVRPTGPTGRLPKRAESPPVRVCVIKENRMLTVSHLTKRYKKLLANDDLSFTVGPGEITVLAGPTRH